MEDYEDLLKDIERNEEIIVTEEKECDESCNCNKENCEDCSCNGC